MAVVSGIKERVHSPIYDSLKVSAGEQLRETEASSTLRFFVDVQRKTKLETNLQSASLLPHYNTFEARAMRVVISDLPPEFPDDVDVEVSGLTGTTTDVTLESDLERVMELLEEARADNDQETSVQAQADATTGNYTEADTGTTEKITLTLKDLEQAVEGLDDTERPASEQIRPNNGAGTLVGKLIYNTVTTLYVGEKIMIQMPTWFFPSGAGPYSETGNFTTHGEPDPSATFRFAEPIFIDRQQNFRVEMEVPDSEVLREIQRIYGPLFIWVVLDGYMTRDVQ